MKKKHLVGFSIQDKKANLELCVFCQRLKNINKPEECVHFEDDYEDVSCCGFIKVDDVSGRLAEALEIRSVNYEGNKA